MSSESFENLSYEDRTFPPSETFIKNANAKSDIYDEANKDRLAFWEKQASKLHWDKKWSKMLTTTLITFITLLERLLATGTLTTALSALFKKALILLGA